MDKNKYKTLAIGLDKEIYAELDKYCKEKSITKSQFMRKIVNNILNKKDSKKHITEKDNRIVKVEVDNYSELEEYVKEKKSVIFHLLQHTLWHNGCQSIHQKMIKIKRAN